MPLYEDIKPQMKKAGTFKPATGAVEKFDEFRQTQAFFMAMADLGGVARACCLPECRRARCCVAPGANTCEDKIPPDSYQAELMRIGMPFCIVIGWDTICERIKTAAQRYYGGEGGEGGGEGGGGNGEGNGRTARRRRRRRCQRKTPAQGPAL